MTGRQRQFNHREFLAGWRRLAAENDIDARTGRPLEHAGTPWWACGDYFSDPGPAHSRVEAEAFRNLAQQVRFITAAPVLPTLAQRMAAEFRAVVKEALEEDRAARRADLPLRQLHALRGVEVIEIEGMRIEVALKRPA